MIDEDVKSSTLNDHISFWRLTAKNYYVAERYKESIFAVDRAIMLTGSSSFSTLGSLYYLRAKILQSLCRSPGAIKFPLTLKPDKEKTTDCEDENDWWSNLVFNTAVDMPYNTFKSIGDVVQECAETYKQASMYLLVLKVPVMRFNLQKLWLDLLKCTWNIVSCQSSFLN